MINLHELDQFRVTDPARLPNPDGWPGDSDNGSFTIASCIDGAVMVVIATVEVADGWDHVSVSRKNRVPNWYEMSQIHRLFFKPDEVCMQLHLPLRQHINLHPHCLHLWRSHNQPIPLPPQIAV